jgi:spore maturation protein CgeB
MRVALFCHSLLSDWNHGNGPFLRGVADELVRRGHRVVVYEPSSGWSLTHLVGAQGLGAVGDFRKAYPQLRSRFYAEETLDLERELGGVELVLVHEWTTHALVRRLGQHRARTGGFVLLFVDTYHRAVTDPAGMATYDLRHYDAVLAFGEALSDLYRRAGWAARVYTWHEAADARLFRPHPEVPRSTDVVWLGNWAEERAAGLEEFLLEPVRALGLAASLFGVGYPQARQAALARAGVAYRGWLANYRAPLALASARLTVHIPKPPYVHELTGIPSMRVFEALACGTPLICAPWEDREQLFVPGRDYLVAQSGKEMREAMSYLVDDQQAARALAAHGRDTILRRHTCAHRVDELLELVASLQGRPGWQRPAPADAEPRA